MNNKGGITMTDIFKLAREHDVEIKIGWDTHGYWAITVLKWVDTTPYFIRRCFTEEMLDCSHSSVYMYEDIIHMIEDVKREAEDNADV